MAQTAKQKAWQVAHREKRKEYISKWMMERRAWIDELKLERGCEAEGCGYKRCAAALHFHHRDPKEKSFTIARISRSANIDRLKAEIAKCIVLCGNCHAEKTWG